MPALQPWAIDLIRNGVTSSAPLNRKDVHLAMRSVMFSAQRSGFDWPTVQALLTDTHRNALARQIARGRQGKTMTTATVNRILDKAWTDIAIEVAKRPAWTRDDALAIVEEIQKALAGSVLPDPHREVMEAAITLAFQKGTTRPTLPVRTLEDMTGIPKSTISRILLRLCDDGDWLQLVRRGNAKARRASIYQLAPLLAKTYAGATPPMPRCLPMSHPPMSQNIAEAPNGASLRLSEAEYAKVLEMRAKADPAEQDSHSKVLPFPLPYLDKPWSVGAASVDAYEPWPGMTEEWWSRKEARLAESLDRLGRAAAQAAAVLDKEFSCLRMQIAEAEIQRARLLREGALKLVGNGD